MQSRYTTLAQKALLCAKDMAHDTSHNEIGSEHILLGLLYTEGGVAGAVLKNHEVDKMKVLKFVTEIYNGEESNLKERPGYTPKAEQILNNAQEESDKFNSELIGTEHILMAMLKETECIATKMLMTMGLNIQKIYMDVLVAMGEDANLYKEEFQNGRPRQKNARQQSILAQYSRDLTQLAKEKKLDPVIGREDEIRRVIQILSRRTKNNPCLIGEPGVGKTAIAEGMAMRIVEGMVPDTLKDKRIVTLDLSGVVAGSKYRGEFEERIKKIIAEVKSNRNILLFIDEIHTIIGAGGAEGAIDASNILKPSLARGEIQIIGATTISEYRKYIEKDAALERRFQPVNIEEPSEEETVEILKGLRKTYEKHHKVTITDDALKAAAAMSKRYINDRFLPDKAIDIIDEAASKARLGDFSYPVKIKETENEILRYTREREEALVNGEYDTAKEISTNLEKAEAKLKRQKNRWEKTNSPHGLVVDEDDIAAIVSMWTKIPLKKLAEEESEKLLNLEKTLHESIIGQEEAVSAVAKAIRRGRVGLKDPNRPIGSFLFLGPTGVGKTELSKTLSKVMFGTDNSMIRVDMSEYMEKHSVSKIIGSPPGYVGHEEGGQLSEKVRRNPYSVILFDEIEKAHPDVFNILLQVLDDGRITDSIGRVVDFKNTIIIMTSNAGAESIIQPKTLGFTKEQDKKKNYEAMKANVMNEVNRLFKPEFINRIDEIIVFHSLSKEDIAKIVDIMFAKIADRAKNQLGITLNIDSKAKEYIIEKGYDEKYGARPLRRIIQSNVEDLLAEDILAGRIKAGNDVMITCEDNQLSINAR